MSSEERFSKLSFKGSHVNKIWEDLGMVGVFSKEIHPFEGEQDLQRNPLLWGNSSVQFRSGEMIDRERKDSIAHKLAF